MDSDIEMIKMNSVVCTLFEGHYHYGVAALANSLYKNDFRGDMYVGYRGEIPFWASEAKENFNLDWEGAKILKIAPDLNLHFLPVVTDFHFTNYKPDFIIEIWEKLITRTNIPGIFYFDPDIVNKCKWDFYEKWIFHGVALVHEIVWNDMPHNHPKRQEWLAVANSIGYDVKNQLSSYINAGFVGVGKDQIGFLRMWCQLMEASVNSFNFDKSKFDQSTINSELFSVGDQDLLNLTAMCTEEKLSEFGPEGMDFRGGGWLMSHATGSPKPWKENFVKSFLSGKGASLQLKEYWKNANGIINCYPESYVKRKVLSQKLSSALGRFYKK